MVNTKNRIAELLKTKPLIACMIVIILAIAFFVDDLAGLLLSLFTVLIIHWLSKDSWKDMGLNRPSSWMKTMLIGFALAVLIIVVTMGVSMLAKSMITNGDSADLSRFDALKNNPWVTVRTIIIIWFTAAFAEELIWRGYVMKRIAILMNSTNIGWIISLIISSIVFGMIHSYQGPLGMIQTGFVGFLFGIVYIKNGRNNLWLNIFIHGFIDTISLTALALGVTPP